MELSWLVTLILGGIILGIIYWFEKRHSNYWEKRGVPFKKSTPFIGIMKDVLLMRKGMGELFSDLYQQFEGERFGGYSQFLSNSILIRDPELINQVLIKDFTHFEDRGPPMKNPNDLFLMGMSNLTGDEWRNVRHKLTPTFTSGKLKMMFNSIKECSEEVIDCLKEKEGHDLEARDFMLRYVINVIGNVAFGLKINTLDERDEQSKEFFKNTSCFFNPSSLLLIKLMISVSFPRLKSALNFKLVDDKVQNFFKGLTKDVIKHRVTSGTKKKDFLQLMLDLKKKEKQQIDEGAFDKIASFDYEPLESEDKELMDQLNNTPLGSYDSRKSEIFTEDFISAQTFLFISGGSETTAAVLSFVLFELAVNQEIQRKVQDEICNVLSGQEINYLSIKKMTYMEQCINETLRLHPIAGVLIRACTSDYKIPGSEVVIEKGTLVNIPVIALHKDPQYFPDPEKFNPDRFEDMETVPKGVYFSFGAGPRICIAMRLAMLEMKVVLAILLQNYTVTLSKKTATPLVIKKNSFLQHVEGGVWVKFHKRKF